MGPKRKVEPKNNDNGDEETPLQRAQRLQQEGYANNTYKPGQDAFLDQEDDED